jgi:aspartyl aminopeptidase
MMNDEKTTNDEGLVTKLADKLSYKVASAWEDKKLNRDRIFEFAEGYRVFLNKTKTEREFVKESVIIAESRGFRDIDGMAEDTRLAPGDKIYRVVKNKLIMLAVIGTKPLDEGVRILGAHIDSPRIDVKQNPLYEANDLAFLKTHYYGGIKKYQWTAIPVAIHGVFVKTDGTTVDVLLGEDEKDPIFTITDLLPHLAKDQYDKKLGDAIAGEALNVLLGSEPYLGEESKEKVKLNMMRLLSEMYGITEEDFLSAELEIVPAFKARDLGLDRSMIGAYGHDDKVCAYPSLISVLEADNPETTSLCLLTDKEEIGSVGKYRGRIKSHGESPGRFVRHVHDGSLYGPHGTSLPEPVKDVVGRCNGGSGPELRGNA